MTLSSQTRVARSMAPDAGPTRAASMFTNLMLPLDEACVDPSGWVASQSAYQRPSGEQAHTAAFVPPSYATGAPIGAPNGTPNGASRPQRGSDPPTRALHSGEDAIDGAVFAHPITGESSRVRMRIGDGVLLAAVLLLTLTACALSDGMRSSSVVGYTTLDTVVLSLAFTVSMCASTRSLLVLWYDLGSWSPNARGVPPQQQQQRNLSRTLLDVTCSYLLSIVTFGLLYALIGTVENDTAVSLVPNSRAGTTLRALDGCYVMTFVAAGVGFPHPADTAAHARPSVAARIVAWICSLVTTTFVGNVLIATALSARLSTSSPPPSMPVFGGDAFV